MLRRCGLVVSTLVACTAPEPVAEAPAWLRNSETRASADLPEKPGDPDWRVLTAIAQCDAHLAADPAKLGRTLDWRPCATGKPGCLELVSPHIDPIFGGLGISLLAATTARGVQVLALESSGAPGRVRISLGPLDGPPFLVFDLESHGGECNFANALFAADTAAVAFSRDANVDNLETIWFAGPLRGDPAWHEPALRFLTPHSSLGPGRMSLSGRALVQIDGEGVRRSDPTTASFLPTQPAPGIRAGFALGPSFVYATRERIAVAASSGAAPVPLYASPEGAVIGPMPVQGGAMYWALGFGRDVIDRFERIELWTAPATDDPGKFTARKLADTALHVFHDLDSLKTGGGMLAYLQFDAQAQAMRVIVVDVATGQRRTWRSPDDAAPRDVLFVDRQELGLTMLNERSEGYRRIRHDATEALGAP